MKKITTIILALIITTISLAQGGGYKRPVIISGDVFKVGTPTSGKIPMWTGDGTLGFITDGLMENFPGSKSGLTIGLADITRGQIEAQGGIGTIGGSVIVHSPTGATIGQYVQMRIISDEFQLGTAAGDKLLFYDWITGVTTLGQTLNFEDYGGGTITGTPTYNLSVDVNGNIIETATGGVSTLQQVLDQGNTATTIINSNGGWRIDPSSTDYTSASPSTFLASNSTIDISASLRKDLIQISDISGANPLQTTIYNNSMHVNNSGFQLTFNYPTLTTNRIIDWQDAPGTVAFLSDIAGAQDLDGVLGVGNISDLNLIIQNGAATAIATHGQTFLKVDDVTNSISSTFFKDAIDFEKNGFIGGFVAPNWTGNRVLTLPDKTGTLAVLSDITGGGDVTKVGTPVNDQIGVWTGDGTIEGVTDFRFDDATSSQLYLGNQDTKRGYIQIYGGSTLGSGLNAYNAANADTDDDFYYFQANSGALQIGGGGTGPAIEYTSSTQNLNLKADTVQLDVYGLGNITGTATRNLSVDSSGNIIETGAIGTTAPASASATGVVGEIRVTSTFIYTCIATNTWVRGAMATW